MRILIRGVSLVNKGAEALLRTIRCEMARRVPEAEFFVEAGNFRHATHQKLQALGVQRLGGIAARLTPRDSAAWLTYRAQRLFSKDCIDPILSDHVNVVLDASGFAYGDDWGPRAANQTCRLMQRLHKAQGKYIFLPQSFGPFEKPDCRQANHEMLSRADLFIARDKKSQRYLGDLTGTATDSVRTCPDLAFRFSDHEPFGNRIIAGIPPRPGAPLVGIAPSRKIYERLSRRDKDAANGYIQLMRAIADHLEDRGCRVLYIPHETRECMKDAMDDRKICRMVAEFGTARRSGSAPSQQLAALEINDAPRLKALIGRCQFLIGSRFHSLVAALSTRRPVIAVGWSHKYEELLRPFGLIDYAHHVGEGATSQQWSQVKHAIRAQIDGLLESKQVDFADELSEHQRAVDELFDHLVEIMTPRRRALAA